LLFEGTKMREWWQSFRETHMTVDTRSLGLFRVAFGLVLFSDLFRRAWELRFWYANTGLLPNHTLLWRPPSAYLFSLFFTLSSVHEAQLGFLLCGLVYAMFLLGYRTRLAQVLTLLARVSLNSRLAVLENGGDMVMDLLCLLTVTLPLGARFSLDAVALARRAAKGEPGEPSADEVAELARRPVVSVAVLGLVLQFATIYFFNAAAKNGHAWRDGTAVYYALHQDKLVTHLGVWMREHLPLSVLRPLTWSTLVVEWTGFILIITPVLSRPARLLAVCVMPFLHLSFALGLNLGGFTPAMMSFYPLLLSAEHWDDLSKRFGAQGAAFSAKVQRALEPLLSRITAPRPTVSSATWRRLSEGAIIVVLVAITGEVLNDNTPVPKALRFREPAWMKAIIEYPRILQGWRMFASEPPRNDVFIYVDAVTSTGAHVDPYNEVASDQPFPAGDIVPTHMGQSQYFVMYSDRIGAAGYAAYRTAFSEWLVAYPERTGHPEDCLLSYEVYLVTDNTPPPGTPPISTPHSRERFMNYRAPSDSTCRPRP